MYLELLYSYTQYWKPHYYADIVLTQHDYNMVMHVSGVREGSVNIPVWPSPLLYGQTKLSSVQWVGQTQFLVHVRVRESQESVARGDVLSDSRHIL